MNKKTIEDVDVSGKRVLVRVDFNVPQDDAGGISDDTRIRAALPTIRCLLDRGAKVVLMSHLGRPEGKTLEQRRSATLSLKPVAERLSEKLEQDVPLLNDCVGPEVEAAVNALQ